MAPETIVSKEASACTGRPAKVLGMVPPKAVPPKD